MNAKPARRWPGIGRGILGGLFVLAGIGHFLAPGVYLKIVPPYLPYPEALVLISGGFEALLGVCILIPRTSRLAAWGLIALLIAVFPANVFMYQHADRFGIPAPWLLLRLPLQGLLIYWAYIYTKRDKSVGGSDARGGT